MMFKKRMKRESHEIGSCYYSRLIEKGGNTMSRCYYLEFRNRGWLINDDKYYCKLCGKEFSVNDPQVKYTCKAEYGEEYKKCPVYRDRR